MRIDRSSLQILLSSCRRRYIAAQKLFQPCRERKDNTASYAEMNCFENINSILISWPRFRFTLRSDRHFGRRNAKKRRSIMHTSTKEDIAGRSRCCETFLLDLRLYLMAELLFRNVVINYCPTIYKIFF